MLNVQLDKIGNVAVVECEGSISGATDAERLGDAVLSQGWARVIMIDLSEVKYLEIDAVEMLAFLRRWALESDIQLKLFNPSSFVGHQFESVDEIFHFEFSSLQGAMDVLIRADAARGRQVTDSELKHAA